MLSVTWAFGPPMEMKAPTGDLVNDLTRDDCRGTACRTLLPGSGADPGYGKPYPYGPSELASLSAEHSDAPARRQLLALHRMSATRR